MSGSPRWASYFVGRAFSTRLELPDEAVGNRSRPSRVCHECQARAAVPKFPAK
jgi:hypothetical protein